MTLRSYLFILLSLFVLSCEKKADYRPQTSEKAFTYSTNKTIERFENAGKVHYSIVEGRGLVFTYSDSRGYNDNAWDNEYSARINFYVDANATSFSYTADELSEHMCFYEGVGAWIGYPATLLKYGHIKGELQDGKWHVDIDVTLEEADQTLNKKQFASSAIYTLQ